MGTIEKHVEGLVQRLKGEVHISVSKTIREKAEENFRWAVVIKLSTGGDFNLSGLAAILNRAWSFSKGVSFLSTSSNIALQVK